MSPTFDVCAEVVRRHLDITDLEEWLETDLTLVRQALDAIVSEAQALDAIVSEATASRTGGER